MTEESYFWGGTTIGDATLAPIDADKYSEIFRRLFCFDTALGYNADSGIVGAASVQLGGIFSGYANELIVANPAGRDITVDTGAAVVAGRLYVNTASIALATLALPAADRYYGVYLKLDDAAQTVRAYIAGPFVAPASLVLANTDAVNYTPLAYIKITAAGAITIYDQRRFLRSNCNQVPIMLSRKGGSTTLWNVGGNVNYELTDKASIMVCSIVSKGVAAPSGSINVWDMLDEYPYGITPPLMIATLAGNTPTVLHNVYTTELLGYLVGAINWYTYDGSNATPTFYVILFFDESEFTEILYDGNVVIQSE